MAIKFCTYMAITKYGMDIHQLVIISLKLFQRTLLKVFGSFDTWRDEHNHETGN